MNGGWYRRFGRPQLHHLDVMRTAVPLTALVLASLGCPVRSVEPSGAVEVPFEILRSSGIGGKTIFLSRVVVARDEAGFQAMWTRTAFATGPVPTVDFDHSMVVAFFGSEGRSCDPYRVARVIAGTEGVTLQIKHRLPWNCVCVSVTFEPYIIVKIPRTDKPIDFVVEPEFDECGKSTGLPA